MGVFAVSKGKGKLEKISFRKSSSYSPPLRHSQNYPSDNFLRVCPDMCHGRQPPLRYPSKTGSSWISGIDVRSGISTEPKFQYCPCLFSHAAVPEFSGLIQSYQQIKKNDQTKNRNITHAMISINAEYLRPPTTLPSPITPAMSPEKKPWSIAAWAKSRL